MLRILSSHVVRGGKWAPNTVIAGSTRTKTWYNFLCPVMRWLNPDYVECWFDADTLTRASVHTSTQVQATSDAKVGQGMYETWFTWKQAVIFSRNTFRPSFLVGLTGLMFWYFINCSWELGFTHDEGQKWSWICRLQSRWTSELGTERIHVAHDIWVSLLRCRNDAFSSPTIWLWSIWDRVPCQPSSIRRDDCGGDIDQ